MFVKHVVSCLPAFLPKMALRLGTIATVKSARCLFKSTIVS